MNIGEVLYMEQQRRRSSGSFGYGDFGIRKNEDLFGLGETDSDDIARGTAIMQQFYTSYVAAYGQPNFSFDDMLAKYATPGNGNLLSLGLGAYSANMTDAQTQAAMDNLVAQGKGQMPGNWNAFQSALSNQATQINWIDAASFVVAQSASQIESGAEKVGQAVITTGSAVTSLFSNKAVIYLALAGAAYYFLARKSSKT